jgi:hypothetical protein
MYEAIDDSRMRNFRPMDTSLCSYTRKNRLFRLKRLSWIVTFLDDKSGGFQVQTSELQTPEALERLFLVLAIATLHFTSVGLEVVRADLRRWVDTHWDRGLSYFKIGWRWLVQQYRRAWRVFATFWLDPAPDPARAIASRRQAARPKRQWTIVQIC